MSDYERMAWRDKLRRDYQQAFDPPPYRPATHLPFGHGGIRLIADLVQLEEKLKGHR